MAKHTPGPYTVVAVDHLGDPAYAIRAADGDLIAVGMLKADATAFAAMPELLAALKLVREFNCKHAPALLHLPLFKSMDAAVFAAIAGATSKSEAA